MNGNTILNSAKYSSDNTDEWYTTYETIAEEIEHYADQFKGKIVLCNCDDPFESNFCYYFLKNFNEQIEKIVLIHLTEWLSCIMQYTFRRPPAIS